MKKRIFLTALCLTLFHVTYSQNSYANFEWAVKAGGTDYEYPTSIAVDQQGNSYITGYFQGTSTFGSTTLTASGPEAFFIAKLNPQGQFLWTVKAESTDLGQDYSNSIAVDSQGNSYVTGNFRGSATFGNNTMTTATDATDGFVAKLDAQGQFVWSVQMVGEASNWIVAKAISIDDQGNSHIAGIFKYGFSSVTFGTTTLTGNDDINGFFTKLNAQGQFLWTVKAEGVDINNSFAMGIAVDAAGNSYATGSFGETATFGNIMLSSSEFGHFIAKLNPQGEYLWAVKAEGSDFYDSSNGIAIDMAGNSYVTGEFSGTATFGNLSLVSSGLRDIFVTKLDPQGQFIWASQAGGTGSDYGMEIVTDLSGNSYIVGLSSSGSATFGNIMLAMSGNIEGYIAKLNPQGQFIEAAKIDVNNIKSIDLDGQGIAYITGWLGSSTFGNTTLVQSGNGDVYVAKLSESLLGLSQEKYENLSVLPNPSHGVYTIVTEESGGSQELELYSVSGQLILHTFTSGERTTIDISDQPNGIYLLSASSQNTVYTYKLIKQ